MPWIADYSTARPDPAQLVKLGAVGAMRYLGPPGDPRCITAAELARNVAAGLPTGPVWETTAHRPLSGRQAGTEDVAAAESWARAVGFPQGVPIVYACDFEPRTSWENAQVDAYYRGVRDAADRHPARPYATYAVVERLCGHLALFPWAWQCAAWSGNGAGSAGVSSDGRRLSRFARLYQRVGQIMGGAVDVNDALGPLDYLHPLPQPVPDPTEDPTMYPHVFTTGPDDPAGERWAVWQPGTPAQLVEPVNAQHVLNAGGLGPFVVDGAFLTGILRRG